MASGDILLDPPARLATGVIVVEQARQSSSRPDASAPVRYLDAGLLFCCMNVLQIDRNKLMRDEPLLYRELQGVRTLCPNKQDCSLDLASGFDGVRWDEWWLYCLNSAMLTTIGALQKCGQSPRYISANAFSHLRLPND